MNLLRHFLPCLSAGTIALSSLVAAPVGNQLEKWEAAAQGTNLAEGKTVWFSKKPNYLRSAKTGHEAMLTDGILSDHPEGKIWFTKEAVGWSSGADNGIDVVIDLGQSQPIDRIVARFLGGGQQTSLVYPRVVSVLVSDDDKIYRRTAELQKVNDGEKELAEFDPDRFFYFPEEGVAFMEPLTVPVQTTARYVVLRITGASSWLFLDEISVLKSETPSALALIESFPEDRLIREGVAITPRADSFVVTPNLPTPNYLTVRDFREDEARGGFRVLIDLPEGVCWLGEPERVERRRQAEGAAPGRVQFIFTEMPNRYALVGPYYFGLEEGAALPQGAEARVSWFHDGVARHTVSVPFKVVEIPEVPASAAVLNASLAWMGGGEINGWPGFYENFRKLGFSAVSTFPSLDPEGAATFGKAARERGMRVLMNDSPFHRLLKRRDDQPEIFNTVRGEKGKTLCPTYTGKYYREEIDRVGALAKEFAPDFIFYDIEIWQGAMAEASRCSTCRDAFAASGSIDWDAFMTEQGTRMMRDLRAATHGTAPEGKTPVTGLYNNKMVPQVYHTVFDFQQIYPRYVDLAQPSLYVQGNAQKVGEVVRENALGLQNREIIPWLTAGTYGRFEPHKVEQMILEAYLNGAGGITYYAARDFDPMAYYHHALALSKLAPHAGLLVNGAPVEVGFSASGVRCSAFGNRKEALVLLANYRGASEEKGQWSFPYEVASIAEIGKASNLADPEDATVGVPQGQQRLFHIVFKP